MYMMYIISFLLLYDVSFVLRPCSEWYIAVYRNDTAVYKLLENYTTRTL